MLIIDLNCYKYMICYFNYPNKYKSKKLYISSNKQIFIKYKIFNILQS